MTDNASPLFTESPPSSLVFLDRHGNCVNLRYIVYTPTNLVAAKTATPLIMIYGGNGRKEYWGHDFIAPLAKSRIVICKDHRGDGGAFVDGTVNGLNSMTMTLTDAEQVRFGYALSPEQFDMRDIADDTIKLATTLFPNHRRVHLAGFSAGGMHCQQTAMRYPEHVASVMLMATTAHVAADISGGSMGATNNSITILPPATRPPITQEERDVTNVLSDYLMGLSTHPDKFFGATFIKSPEYPKVISRLNACASIAPVSKHAAAAHKIMARRSHNMMQQMTLDSPLRHSIPLLIMHGADDPLFPLSSVTANYNVAYPNANIVVIPNAGHMLPFEAPLQVLQHMITAMNKCDTNTTNDNQQ